MSRIQYRPLAAAPELHQDWHTEQQERDVTWPELFFDLFFVAAVSNLSHLFDKPKHPDVADAGRVVLYHTIIFFVWSDYVTLRTRYKLPGLLFRCIGLTLQLGTLALIIAVRDDHAWYKLLASGYAVARAAMAAAHTMTAIFIPRARLLSMTNLAACIVLCTLAIVAAWVPYGGTSKSYYGIFTAIAVSEVIMPMLPSLLFPKQNIPIHVEHFSERLGQLIMLHLGEAIIGFAMSPLAPTVQQFVAVAIAAVLVWSLHLCYYHIEPDQRDHAFGQSRFRGLLFFYSHWPLAVAFLLMGSSLRLLLGTYSGQPNHHAIVERTNEIFGGIATAGQLSMAAEHDAVAAPFEESLMLCVAYAASLHLMALIRAAHYFSLDPSHSIVKFQQRQGVMHWWNAWWGVLWLWPIPIYFIPLGIRRINNKASNHHNNYTVDFSDSYNMGSIVASATDGWQPVTVTHLLITLAAHALMLTCVESLLAHKITKTPVLQGSQDINNEAPAAGDMGPHQLGEM